jgi:hypothetical protein
MDTRVAARHSLTHRKTLPKEPEIFARRLLNI